MSTSSDHHPPAGPSGTGQPSTQEIPVVAPDAPGRAATTMQQLPPPGSPPAAPAAPLEAVQPTGPVDFVPGLPGAGPPPLPPPPAAVPLAGPAPGTPPAAPAAEPGRDAPPTVPAPSWPESLDADEPAPAPPKRPRSPRDLAAITGPALAVLALAVLEVGLLVSFGSVSYWSAVPLWSAFATAATVVALLAFVAFYPARNRLRPSAVWRLAAGGLVGLAVFWVLVVLPEVASDRGFVLTAALACLGGAVWVGPRRNSRG